MKKLSEFSTVDDARVHMAVRGRMISQDMIFALLIKHKSLSTLESSDHPDAIGFIKALSAGVKEFNLMNNHPVGLSQQHMLAELVTAKAVTSGFMDEAIDYANPVINPYENVTLHEYEVAKGTAPAFQVSSIDGWVKITVSDQVEKHNPRLMAESPRTGKRVRINSFYEVGSPGAYECLVPREWRNSKLFVDNSYGVIS